MTGSLAQHRNLPPLSLVVGGARSGKSRLAEGLVTAPGLKRHYIATAEIWDDEMKARVAQHQTDRGADWHTWNAPFDLDQTLALIPPGEVVLLDCATLWLSNHLLAGSDIGAKSAQLLAALGTCASPVVVVSNEVGWGIVPENALARAFRDHQGRLNQQIAEQAHLVVGVMAGLPIVLKGQWLIDDLAISGRPLTTCTDLMKYFRKMDGQNGDQDDL
jgi:adenosylcobinamide kinase / adenosylcobinamide-phosphate guanylyltransferase